MEIFFNYNYSNALRILLEIKITAINTNDSFVLNGGHGTTILCTLDLT